MFTINRQNMKTLHPFISFWVNPRKTIQQLTVSCSPSNDARLVGFLSMGYFVQIALFILMVDVIPGSVFFSMKGLQGMGGCLIAIAITLYTYASLSSLMIWTIAKCLKGNANSATTRTTLLWSMLGYLPVGFSILLVYFAYNQKLMGKPIFLLDIFSLIALSILFVYSFILMLKMVSEINHFPIWRSFLTLLLCAIIQGGVIFILLRF